jgi:catechol 2,3-dioxygenase-like lactoylglutathione lyase family enzyme
VISRELAYVALVSREPAALADLLGKHLGLAATSCATGAGDSVPVFSVGRSALAVFPAGHPYVGGEAKTGVHHIGIGVSDMTAAKAAVERAGVKVVDSETAALGGGSRLRLDGAGLAGVQAWLVTPLLLAPSRNPLVERLDHLGIASADNTEALATWCGKLGLPLESQQTDMEVATTIESFTSDKYGVVYHTRPPVPVAGLRVAFATIGDTELEFLQNFNPAQAGQVDHGRPGTTRQDQGAIARFIASRGAGLHHVALKTGDIDGVLASLHAAGIALIDLKGRPGSRRARIGFIDPRPLGGVLLHFVERQELP